MFLIKKAGFSVLFLFSLILVSCDQNNPNYAWLLSIADPTNRAGAPEGEQAFNLNMTTSGDSSFLEDADHTVNVLLVANFEAMYSVSVQVTDENNNDVLLSFSPARSGNFTGSFTVDGATRTVHVIVVVNGVRKEYLVSIVGVDDLNLTLSILAAISPVVKPAPVLDRDGDGIPDAQDAYPDDPSRSSKLLFPSSDEGVSFYTAAFESRMLRDEIRNGHDLHSEGRHSVNRHSEDRHSGNHHSEGRHFHGKGIYHAAHADFNDYVVRVSGEGDLNAAGEIVRLRLRAQHVAGGALHDDENESESDDAGRREAFSPENKEFESSMRMSGFESRESSDHHEGSSHRSSGERSCHARGEKGYFLKINLPVNASYSMMRTGGPENVFNALSGVYAAGSGLEILPSSMKTLASSNTGKNSVFNTGMISDVEFIFERPVRVSELGMFPYDLYISYENGKSEIHFPGFVTDEDGRDPFLSDEGLRNALLIPGDWFWPLENVNIHRAYPDFYGWYTSGGAEHSDWHLNYVDRYVFVR